MALPILDGNQTAATLSTIITGGAHIPAHTVVSLGSQAISDITSGVSGSVVSISNFPASQTTTFGAVTGSVSVLNFPASQSVTFAQASVTFGATTGSVSVLNFPSTQTVAGTVTANVADLISQGTDGDGGPYRKGVQLIGLNWDNDGSRPVQTDNVGQLKVVAGSDSQNFPIYGTVTVGNSVTIGSLPAISGTVTANLTHENLYALGLIDDSDKLNCNVTAIKGIDPADWLNSNGGDVPISGTVTAAAPNGSLTTRFGTPTTANTAFATSCVTNANRKYLLIQNVTTGSNVITVGIGFTPTTTQGIQLTAGAGITFESSYIPTGAVYVLSSVTASNFTILEA